MGRAGVVMDFHAEHPLWMMMMITCHVLSGFYDFLFSCNAGNEGRDYAWDGLVGVNNDCTDEFKYPLF